MAAGADALATVLAATSGMEVADTVAMSVAGAAPSADEGADAPGLARNMPLASAPTVSEPPLGRAVDAVTISVPAEITVPPV